MAEPKKPLKLCNATSSPCVLLIGSTGRPTKMWLKWKESSQSVLTQWCIRVLPPPPAHTHKNMWAFRLVTSEILQMRFWKKFHANHISGGETCAKTCQVSHEHTGTPPYLQKNSVLSSFLLLHCFILDAVLLKSINVCNARLTSVHWERCGAPIGAQWKEDNSHSGGWLTRIV